jgi:hypothetical protein
MCLGRLNFKNTLKMNFTSLFSSISKINKKINFNRQGHSRKNFALIFSSLDFTAYKNLEMIDVSWIYEVVDQGE